MIDLEEMKKKMLLLYEEKQDLDKIIEGQNKKIDDLE